MWRENLKMKLKSNTRYSKDMLLKLYCTAYTILSAKCKHIETLSVKLNRSKKLSDKVNTLLSAKVNTLLSDKVNTLLSAK